MTLREAARRQQPRGTFADILRKNLRPFRQRSRATPVARRSIVRPPIKPCAVTAVGDREIPRYAKTEAEAFALLLGPSGSKLLLGPTGKLTEDLDCCCDLECCVHTCADHPDPLFLTMVWSDCDVLTGTFQLDSSCTDPPNIPAWFYTGTVDGCDIEISFGCEGCFGGGLCYIVTITLGTGGCIVINLQCDIVSCNPFEVTCNYDVSSNGCGVGEDCGCDDMTFVSGFVVE